MVSLDFSTHVNIIEHQYLFASSNNVSKLYHLSACVSLHVFCFECVDTLDSSAESPHQACEWRLMCMIIASQDAKNGTLLDDECTYSLGNISMQSVMRWYAQAGFAFWLLSL